MIACNIFDKHWSDQELHSGQVEMLTPCHWDRWKSFLCVCFSPSILSSSLINWNVSIWLFSITRSNLQWLLRYSGMHIDVIKIVVHQWFNFANYIDEFSFMCDSILPFSTQSKDVLTQNLNCNFILVTSTVRQILKVLCHP